MKSKIPFIRPLKASDIDKCQSFGLTFRGVAVELDGQVIAVAAVLHSSPLQAFSEMDDKLRKYPKTIVRVILSFKDILSNYEQPVYAIASEQELNSPRVLERIGFEQIDGGMYRWRMHNSQ